MKFIFLCFVFSFLTIVPAHSQKAQSDKKDKDIVYFGNISEDVMNQEQAAGIVKYYFDRKLKNTTRHAVIAPSSSDDIITVNIVEIDGSPFYSMDIDRRRGTVINDKQYDRYRKIQADLQKKKQEAMARAALRDKSMSALSDDAEQQKKTAPTVNNVKKNTATVSEQPPANNSPRRRRRRN